MEIQDKDLVNDSSGLGSHKTDGDSGNKRADSIASGNRIGCGVSKSFHRKIQKVERYHDGKGEVQSSSLLMMSNEVSDAE
jgi:hypothetical protein